jgi:glucose/arabinose dehydrogenase
VALAGLAGMQRVASGLSNPIYTTQAPGDPNRLFIATRGGSIRILDLTSGVVSATPFLTIAGVDAAGEGGFRGLAFHPDYATNGKFYVNVTIDNGGQNYLGATSPFSVHIQEYTTDPSVAPHLRTTAPASSLRRIIDIVHPHANHNAGWIGFSPNDGYLYVPTGDGGGNGNDLDNDGSDTDGDVGGHTQGTGNAQDTTSNLLGKVLRLDVNGDDFPGNSNKNYAIPASNPFTAAGDDRDDEIWAYGLRNPFRGSFDRATGDLWIGDVGQGTREEVNRQPGSSDGGENYGWRLREGAIQNPHPVVGGPRPADNVDPVYDYGRSGTFGGNIVLGGHVYRGPDPTLQGKYLFGDTGANKFWMFDPANPYGTVTNIQPLLTPNVGSPNGPVAYGEDLAGNLYITFLYSGDVYKIVTNAFTPGDFNADAVVDGLDMSVWSANFGSTTATRATGDADGDADVDGADFLAWQRNLGWSALNPLTQPAGASVPEPSTIALALAAAAALLRSRRATWPGHPGREPSHPRSAI